LAICSTNPTVSKSKKPLIRWQNKKNPDNMLIKFYFEIWTKILIDFNRRKLKLFFKQIDKNKEGRINDTVLFASLLCVFIPNRFLSFILLSSSLCRSFPNGFFPLFLPNSFPCKVKSLPHLPPKSLTVGHLMPVIQFLQHRAFSLGQSVQSPIWSRYFKDVLQTIMCLVWRTLPSRITSLKMESSPSLSGASMQTCSPLNFFKNCLTSLTDISILCYFLRLTVVFDVPAQIRNVFFYFIYGTNFCLGGYQGRLYHPSIVRANAC